MKIDRSECRYLSKLLLTCVLAAAVSACGGGGSSDDGDDTSESSTETGSTRSVVSRGVITRLGSIYVNGVKYETPKGNSYKNDDSTGTVARFKVGQVVSLRGEINDDGVTGVASEVEYEAEIEGIANGGAINGISIVLSSTTNSSEIPGFGGVLADAVRYEVSGFWLDDQALEATYIKLDDDGDGEDEIKGFVKNVVAATSFDVRGITFDTATPPAAGSFVEVHFDPASCSAPPMVTCTPTQVEIEDDFDDHANGQDAEIEGAVNTDAADLATCPAAADFLIDMTCIDWDSVPAGGWMDGLESAADMAAGLRVEAEGHFNAEGLLIAEKIKGRGNRVRASSTASNIDAGGGSFELFFGDIQVTTMDGLTEFELDNMGTSVTSINPGDGLEVRGIRTGASSMLALKIESESVDPDRHRLRAEVDLDGADPATNLISVMGISSLLDSDTELEIEDVEIAPGDGLTREADIDAFLGMIDDDNIVNSTNGPRDIVDVKIDTTNGGDGSNGNPYSAEDIELEEEDD